MKRELVFTVCVTIALTLGATVLAQAVNTLPRTGTGEQNFKQAVPAPQAKNIFRSVNPSEAMRMLQSRKDMIFLDVRTPQERANGAIPGSQLVSFYDLVKGGVPLPKDMPIMLVCAVGGRSYVAGQVLSKQGYKEVYNLSGGIKGWYLAGLPIVHDPVVSRQSAR